MDMDMDKNKKRIKNIFYCTITTTIKKRLAITNTQLF